MRRIVQKIDVQTLPDGSPETFAWRGRSYRVQQIIECWKEAGCWWDYEPEREVYRLLDSAGKTFELHCLHTPLFTINRKQEDGGLLFLLERQSGRKGPGRWILYAMAD